MAVFTAIAIGLGLAAAGTIYSAVSANKAAKGQERAQIRAENLRQQQNQLDAMRRRRQAIREAMLARANTISAGTNQGAGQGSGVAGGAGQATATGFQNQQTINASETLGAGVFDANRAYYRATSQGQIGQAWGSALTSLGGMIVNNAGTIARLGQFGAGAQTSGSGGYSSQLPGVGHYRSLY